MRTINGEPVWQEVESESKQETKAEKEEAEDKVRELWRASNKDGTKVRHVTLGEIRISDELIETIMRARPEERDYVNTAYYHGPAPRYCKAYGKAYKFAGVEHAADPIPDCLKGIMRWACQFAPFNGLLINWYENGYDYIGPHRDDEKALVKGEPIMTISVGATRKFRVRNSENKILEDFEMYNGSFIMMKYPFQDRYTHEIVKITGEKGLKTKPRASLTFRVFQ